MTGEGGGSSPRGSGTGRYREEQRPPPAPAAEREAETCISVPPDKALENDMLFPPPARRAVQFSQ